MRRQFVIGCLCLFCLAWGVAMAFAAGAEVALFREALAPYGEWLQHPRHGLVWRPTPVDRSWRPYTNGRWVLTQDGYVFETDEPWGWATYHYGNWQNSSEYGWVWVPGTTWYPHTVTWRSSDEYVGWAPVPPPDITDNDLTWQDGYRSGGSYIAKTDYASSLPSSYWNFTRAMDFLLGWGEPYAPSYSYARSGLLVVPYMVPVVYERTIYIYNYVTPAYAPRACFNWGPPVTYITKVKHLPPHVVQRFCQRHRLEHLHHVLPPRQVLDRHPAWRQLVPVAQRDQAQPPRWWKPAPARGVALNHPQALEQLPGPNQPRQQVRSSETAQTPLHPFGQPVPHRPGQAKDQALPGPRPGRADELRRQADRVPVAGQPLPSALTPTASPAGSPPAADRPGAGQKPRRLERERGLISSVRPQGQESSTVPQTVFSDRREQAAGSVPLTTPTPQPPADATSRQAASTGLRPEQERPSPGLPSTPDLNRRAEPPRRPPDQERQRVEEMARQQADKQRPAQQQQQEQQRELLRQEQERRQAELLRRQEEQQRRQADLMRQQQAQQQRHLEMVRQQQEQQRQAMLQQQQEQRRQAEILRQQQEQQRRQAEMARQQHQSRQQPPPGQKRRPPFE